MAHTIIGDDRLHARFHVDGLHALLVAMREGGLLAPVAEPLAARWMADIDAYETEGFVALSEEPLRDDAAREALRGAAHAAAARLTRVGIELPLAVREATDDAEALRRAMLAQARALVSYLDGWHAMAGARAPAA